MEGKEIRHFPPIHQITFIERTYCCRARYQDARLLHVAVEEVRLGDYCNSDTQMRIQTPVPKVLFVTCDAAPHYELLRKFTRPDLLHNLSPGITDILNLFQQTSCLQISHDYNYQSEKGLHRLVATCGRTDRILSFESYAFCCMN